MTEMRDHKGEVQSVECNYKNTNVFLSAGSDGAVKLWDLQHGKLVSNFPAHKGISYQATWHPQHDNLFASVGVDGSLKLWDLKNPK